MKIPHLILIAFVCFLVAACSGKKTDETTDNNATTELDAAAQDKAEKVVMAPVDSKGIIMPAVVLSPEKVKELCGLPNDTELTPTHNNNQMLMLSTFRWRKANWKEISEKNAQGKSEFENIDESLQVQYIKGSLLNKQIIDEEFEKNKKVVATKIIGQKAAKDGNRTENETTILPLTSVEGIAVEAFWEAERKQLIVKTENAVFVVRNSYQTEQADALAIAKKVALYVVQVLGKKKAI